MKKVVVFSLDPFILKSNIKKTLPNLNFLNENS